MAKAIPNQREAKALHILGERWQGAGAGLAEGGHSADSVTNEAVRTLLAVLSCRVPLAVLHGKRQNSERYMEVLPYSKRDLLAEDLDKQKSG